jgi:hypothetical protein
MIHNERVREKGKNETHLEERNKKERINYNRTNEYSSISDKGNIQNKL